MKKTIALILAIVMTMALVACGGNPTTSNNPGSSSSDSHAITNIEDINKGQEGKVDETKNYKKSMEVAVFTVVKLIDPMLDTGNTVDMVYKLMYNHLVSYNWETREVEPELAESWTMESPTSYVINLRKGVKFSNGEELTADDVVFTFERAKAVGATTGTAVWNNVDAVDVINDYSVRIKFVKGDADFLYRMYLACYAIFNREACESDPEKGHLIGTGGWILDSWSTNDHVTLVRNDSSWVWEEKGLNPTEKLILRHYGESSAASIALQNGELAAGTAFSASDIVPLTADPNVHVLSYNAESMTYVFFNMKNGKLAEDVKLRQAVAYALNYDDITILGTDGRGERAYSMWGKNQYGLFEDFDEQYVKNNEKAKALLAEAGYPNGFELHMVSGSTTLSTVIKEQLKEVGITVNVEIVDTAGKAAAVKSGDFDMMEYNISLQSIGDRFAFIPNINHSTNRAKYDNPEMMAKFTAAMAETDDAKRKEIYKEIQIELHEEIPYLPLYYKVSNVGYHDGVSGILWEADNKADFTHIRWEEK